jgi:4-hydroxybenzoate polyprenyltransferase
MGGSITAVAKGYTNNLTTLFSVFYFFALKVFINSVIYDYKDLRGDATAGIKTLPICLGIEKTKRMLQIMCFGLHIGTVIAMSIGTITFEPIILLYSFGVGLICTFFFARPHSAKESKMKKLALEVLVDGESFIAVGLTMSYKFLISTERFL